MMRFMQIVVLVVLLPLAAMAGENGRVEVSEAEGGIDILSLYDLEKRAGEALARGPFGYVQGGAEDEVTLRRNTSIFDRKFIVPNGLRGIGDVDLRTTFLGIDLASPIILAPMAAHGLVHREADRATIKGTHAAGTIMAISTYSSVLIEDVAKSDPEAPFFFQLYMTTDEGFNDFIVKKARDAGAKAIILTIDSGIPGNREADVRNNYNYSSETPNLDTYYQGQNMTQSEARKLRKKSFTPDDIRFVKQAGGLPVLVKGIMSPEAATVAIEAGADGIWISNHGGRQLDGAPATFEVLPFIAEAVDKRVPIVFDSGVRRGSHVFKALSSGADVVAVGRPALYGLILGGSEGVRDVFLHLNKELTTAMVLAGTETIDEVKNAILFTPEKQ